MSFLLPHDSLRLAAALLARASAGSAFTALVLLVLVSAAAVAGRPTQADALRAETAGEVDGAERRVTADARGATPRHPQGDARALRPSAMSPPTLWSVIACTLPPARGP